MSGLRSFTDCFSVLYNKVDIVSNGLCGYSAIAYCVTGNAEAYVNMIDDALRGFDLNENLFVQQVEKASHTSLADYKEIMRVALDNVAKGGSLPRALWMDDGYLVAFSLIFNISIFVYNVVLRKWLVYNDNGEEGYVCLVFNGSHYDVLIGCNTLTPQIPHAVVKQGVNHDDYRWVNVNVDGHKYSFSRVWKWPNGRPEVNVANEFTISVQSGEGASELNYQKVRIPTRIDEIRIPSVETEHLRMPEACLGVDSGVVNSPLLTKSSKVCKLVSCTDCKWTGRNDKALRMHKMRSHANAVTPVYDDSISPSFSNVSIDLHSASVDEFALSEIQRQVSVSSENESFSSNDEQSVMDESYDSDLSMSSVRSDLRSSRLPTRSPLVLKTLTQRGKEMCKNCGNYYVDIRKHIKCSMKLQKKSAGLEFHLSNESLDSIDHESMADESNDSDVTLSSNSELLTDFSVMFKKPLPARKEYCKSCGNYFVSLSKHIKCSMKLEKQSIEKEVVQSGNELEDYDYSSDNHLISSNVINRQTKEQCQHCLGYFVSLANHRRCKKNQESRPARELKNLDMESDSSIQSLSSDDEVVSSRSSSVSSQSSSRSIRYHRRTAGKRSMQGEQCMAGYNDSDNISNNSRTSIDVVSAKDFVGETHDISSCSNRVSGKIKDSQLYCKRAQVRGTKVYICNLCNKKCRTRGSWNLHHTSAHMDHNDLPDVNDSIGIVETSLTNSCDTKNPIGKKRSGTTRKAHVAHDFSVERENLKKKYLSKKVPQQIDPLYDDLKKYEHELVNVINNVTTERMSHEILNVVENPDIVGDERDYTWSKEDQERLRQLNVECKDLQPRDDWFWDPKPGTPQAIYNDKRLQFCMDNELVNKLVQCKICKSTSLMVGIDQVNAEDLCYDCIFLKDRSKKFREEKMKAWDEVRPVSEEYPKRTEPGHTHEDLPYLYPGEKAVIALVHPVVTVKKTYFRNKKLRRESISLLGEPDKTWVKVLPRTDLKERFFVLERTTKEGMKRHIVANRERVEVWLRYLLKNHGEYKRRMDSGELEISYEALKSLESQCELACVESTTDEVEDMSPDAATDHGIIQPALESGFQDHHVLAFDKFPNLYLKKKDVLKIRQGGKIEIIQDDTQRRPIYNSSANVAFPSLFANGEKSPLDFNSYTIARDLLKKQIMFAHRMASGKLEWVFADDDIYLMHTFARLCEQRVHAHVAYYISQHAEAASHPIESVLNAFRDGFDDTGLLDSKLPDLTMLMTKLPNSRQYWFQERQALETMSRDLTGACLFMTINPEPRYSPDIRALIHSLHFPNKPIDKEWNFSSTEEFTELMSKYAPHVCIYLWRKIKIFMRAFLNDICRIPEKETCSDWTSADQTENSYYWFRTEFTETRGMPHFHCMVKLPNTLDTAVLGRMVHNMRVVREEMKRGNIKSSKISEAWDIIRYGLLASRYLVMLADSISSASFYTERVESFDSVDQSKVIDLDALRAEFEVHMKAGTHTNKTHPLMRKYDDPACPDNPYIDIAQVAAASCLHNCIQKCCGGNQSGIGCRFSFPKKKMNCTVPAVMQVNSEQSEAQVLLRRTNARVCNSNRYILRYLRCNNDLQFICSASHSMRYATKYCTKSAKHDVLLNEMIEHINSRSTDIIRPSMNQILSHLLLADCSHRAFMSKHELSWNILGLPDVSKSFTQVRAVGFYPRANIFQCNDGDTIEYSDRTEYSAYSERCRDSTVIRYPREASSVIDHVRIDNEIANMCFREFCERICYKWKTDKEVTAERIDSRCTTKIKTRDVKSGHWLLSFYKKRQHIRPSISLFTKPAIEYEPIDADECTSQTAYYDQPREKRQQLLRAYQELVFYVPWRDSPDEYFLSEEARSALNDDPERQNRYSLRRLQAFFGVYQLKWAESLGPQAVLSDDPQTRIKNEQWFRCNQFSYSMFLATQQNTEIRVDRSANNGVLTAIYDEADELRGTDVNVSVNDENDNAEYPSVLNFYMPNDGLEEIMKQPKMDLSEIFVLFPLQHAWQTLEDMVRNNKVKMFMARPPVPSITVEKLTVMQKFAYDCMLDDEVKVLYVCGKAGSGKSTVALMACEQLKGRVQCAAVTGRAASIFNAPTVHSALQWSIHGSSSSTGHSANKIGQMQAFYENTGVFVIDEVNALSADSLALMHETMSRIFNPDNRKTASGDLVPFGGQRVICLGDAAQLRPVKNSAIFDETAATSANKRKRARQTEMELKGQLLYRKYLQPNTIMLKRGQRNEGLLQVICDRIRDGKQTSDDLAKLTHLRRKFPEAHGHFGIHYDNQSCNVHNLRQLWYECQNETPNKRLYICRATYEDSDQSVSDGLASLPAKVFNYTPNLLCVSVMCLVRITKNINVKCGLVNGAIARVVQVLYDNADVKSVLDGENPTPHCILVEFEGFQGLSLDPNKPDERFYPVDSTRRIVPIYREKIHAASSKDIPDWIRKKQNLSQCYRHQFPLDLATHMTAHRSQGQTLGDSIVAVDMNLDNPDNAVPNDIGSIIYVALTRVNKLKQVLLSPIFPSAWDKIGKSEMDDRRRKAETQLVNAAEKFAISRGMYDEYIEEMTFVPNYGDMDREWDEIRSLKEFPERPSLVVPLTRCELLDMRFKIPASNEISSHPLCLKPALSERHIGIDQGRRNFAISCVDKFSDSPPRLIAAELYDLNLPKRFKMLDLAISLLERTRLMDWMQLNKVKSLPLVDRIVVHLEQVSIAHGSSREFTIQLGQYLQSKAVDLNTCVVKLSQPNMHGRNGPMFKMGEHIVKSLSLTPCTYRSKKADFQRKRPLAASEVTESNRLPKTKRQKSDKEIETNAALPDDVETEDDDASTSEYRRKKKMSAAIFEYIVNASPEMQVELGFEVDTTVQDTWKSRITNSSRKLKLDDVGDSVLIALHEILCGSTNYRQLVPSSSSINNNRSVAIAVLPHVTYWVVLNCQFNIFTLEDMGMFESSFEGMFYRAVEVEKLIVERLQGSLRVALTDFSGDSMYEKVRVIKIIVKQLQGLAKYNLTRVQAGALTQASYNAMKSLIDSSFPADSKVSEKRDKTGHMYIRTDSENDEKFLIMKSSGKHLNAVVPFLEWFKDSANRVIEKRDIRLNQSEKLTFFETLESLAAQDESRLEMMKMSDFVKAKLTSGALNEYNTKRVLADLILIAINKNQAHVKAIAANYRRSSKQAVLKRTRSSRSKSESNDELSRANVIDKDCMLVEPANEQYSDVEPD